MNTIEVSKSTFQLFEYINFLEMWDGKCKLKVKFNASMYNYLLRLLYNNDIILFLLIARLLNSAS